MESEEAATEGEEGEDDVPTGPLLTLVARSATTCMLFIGKTHACYFRAFITAGASFFLTELRLMLRHRKKKKESGLFAFDAVKCYFNVKQAPFFCHFVFHSLSLHSIFFSLSLSLIFRHEVDTRMINMPYAPHSFVLLPSSL